MAHLYDSFYTEVLCAKGFICLEYLTGKFIYSPSVQFTLMVYKLRF